MSIAPNSTLLFIPDISGFTDFVNETEIEHSRHIIEELLESLIDANVLEMQVSEIEGDAILFFRPGQAPNINDLLAQIRRMFLDFHLHLKKYEQNRICQCGACCSATNLSLKFVLHYGEVAANQVKDHSKLFGREVIVVHRLLKNSIDGRQYAIITDALFQSADNHVVGQTWSDFNSSEEVYDVGSIGFQYLDLGPLVAEVPEPGHEDFAVSGASRSVMSLEEIIEAPLELVFDVVSDLAFRANWIEGLIDSDELNHGITQAGSTHRCVIKRDDSDPRFVAHDYRVGKDVITFVESNHRQKFSTRYLLRRINTSQTKLELEVFLQPSFFIVLFFRLFLKPKLTRSQVKNMADLKTYCQKLVSSGQNHPNHIELYASTSLKPNVLKSN